MRTVLAVDDDETIRLVIRAALEDEGYAVLEAAGGLEAMAALGASAVPLLVLLDDWMADLGGMEVLRAAEEDPALMRHAYTLVTAGQRGVPDFPFAVGMLAKPFDLEDLVEAVRAMELHLPAGTG